MGKVNDLLVAESENYISALLAEKLPENFIYHNFSNALRVKKYAETIGEKAGFTADEMNILRICALFHGTGYVNSYEQYNEESIVIASAFLAEHGLDQQTIDHVSDAIRALKQPQDPKDKIAEVLEAAVRRLADWQQRRKLLENKKESRAKKGITYSRGVDTMFRVTARNQINLNSIADNKSNILISVNAIIISIIITMLAGNIGNMSQDIFPILVFLLICLVTIIIAIMSTRPNLVNNKFTREDIKNKSVDLTFFGNFIKMNYDDYLKAVKDMMTDDEHLYSTLLKNQYELGKILAKKFRLVKLAYNVFMIGIIITVAVFLLNYLFTHR